MKNKKQAIIEAASKIIGEKGYSLTTIDEIAAKSGIGKGTFYIYFKNKDDLFFAIIEENFNQFLSNAKASIEKIDDFFEKIRKFIEMYLSHHEKNYFLFKILVQEKPSIKKGEFMKFWSTFFSRWDFLKNEISDQIKAGTLKNFGADDIMHSLLGILHGNIHKWLLSGREYSLVKKTDIVYQMFVNGIRNKK
ncbi:MAG TPA: TetR/AcrR family transcriptional regulator [bacterium]|nr:TetR/AcrR family transcriptional regulator [bacterium]